jgi:hypothetical protein
MAEEERQQPRKFDKQSIVTLAVGTLIEGETLYSATEPVNSTIRKLTLGNRTFWFDVAKGYENTSAAGAKTHKAYELIGTTSA